MPVVSVGTYIIWPDPPPPPPTEEAKELVENKGTEANRHRDQGAKQIPLFILKNVYSKYSGKPLIQEMKHFGFLVEPVTTENPHGLPLGIGVAQHGKYEISSMNCASCHTGRIRVDDQLYNVEGGGNLTSSGQWAHVINDSIDDLKNPVKLLGFLIRLMKNNDLPEKYTPENTSVADIEKIQSQFGKDPVERPVSSDSNGVMSAESQKMVEDEARELARSQAVAEMLKKTISGEKYTEELFQEVYLKELLKKKKILEDYYNEEGNEDNVDFFKDELEAKTSYYKKYSDSDFCQNSEKLLVPDKWSNTSKSSSSLLKLLLSQKQYADRAFPVIEKIGNIGPGRDDAWFVLGALVGGNTDVVMEHFEPAPTKIPNLFSYSYYSRTKSTDSREYHFHYDGNTNSLMQRNYLQAMAVGALSSPNHVGGYESEAKIDEIHNADMYYQQIKIPNFSKIFPKHFNPDHAKKGEAIFAQNCLSCHDRPEGKMIPIGDVKTDPKRWRFFNGEEKKELREGVLKSIELKTASVYRLSLNRIIANGGDSGGGSYEMENPQWFNAREGYMARTLNGVWASPPYLHNGSVRTIQQLLTPAAQREKSFYVGTRDYDTENLGYKNYGDDKNKDVKHYVEGKLTTYKIDVDGINVGHEYGTKLSDEEKLYLIEYIKTLGDPEEK